MKKSLLIVAGVASLLAGGAAMAATSPAPAPAPAPGARPDRAERVAEWRQMREKRVSDAFSRLDANRDGRVSFEEFRADLERRKVEREHRMFERFSGGAESFTLDQLKTAMAERRGPGGFGGHGRHGGRGFGPGSPGGPGGLDGHRGRGGPGFDGPPPPPPAR